MIQKYIDIIYERHLEKKLLYDWNNKLNKYNALDKNWIIFIITKSKLNRTLEKNKETFKGSFLFKWSDWEKRLEFCHK